MKLKFSIPGLYVELSPDSPDFELLIKFIKRAIDDYRKKATALDWSI